MFHKYIFNSVNQKLIKWPLLLVLSYGVLIVAEAEPKEVEETKPTLVTVNFLYIIFNI